LDAGNNVSEIAREFKTTRQTIIRVREKRFSDKNSVKK
ncbi:MAG: helix-turn-helix domain-containing protein, partial [Sulfurimonas sp.]|nr:helix-turn-helix domain-containing protein [Sulfurimonas sp.]